MNNSEAQQNTACQPASLFALFYEFAKIGLVTFGGGMGMLPMIERAIVDKRHWLPTEEFDEIVVVSTSLPGAIALSVAVAVGNKKRGIAGAISGIIGAVLPSFMVILIVAWLLLYGTDLTIIDKFFAGVRPVVVAMLFDAALRMGKRNIKSLTDWLILIAGTLLIFLAGINGAFIILVGGLLGLSYYRRKLYPPTSQEGRNE